MRESFADREAASIAAADRIEAALERRMGDESPATLVVSGGTTPARCFEHLATRALDWERVNVTLSDERWVPADDAHSNERMVRETLLTGPAGQAGFTSLYDAARTPAEFSDELETRLRRVPFPFACALLGMGEDGHFASLFPDADNLAQGLDPDGSRMTLPVETAASPHPRITMTLAALSRSDEIVLLIFGDAKLAVLDRAIAASNGDPVSHLLRQKRAPVHVIWAP